MSGGALGRRAVLQLFGGAAVMGRGAVKVAAEAIAKQPATLGAVGSAVAGYAEPEVVTPSGSLVDKALRRLVREVTHAAEIEQEVEYRVARNELPPSISAMRSWSPAFRAHVFRKKRMAEGLSWRLHDRIDGMTEVEKLALAAKLGVQH